MKKYTQTEMDIQKLNSTLDRINEWMDEQEKKNLAQEKKNEAHETRIVDIEKVLSKQSVVTIILAVVGSSVLTIAISKLLGV